MNMLARSFFSFVLALVFLQSLSQNETNKWYFGQNAGLDFMTNPPTVLTNGAIFTNEGCATISDASGNLLFYTDGVTVFDKNHAVMANGSGLNGHNSSSQSAIIAKQPGNANIYYVFTQSGTVGIGAGYSVVDMSLAAGIGSVTVKNMTLSTPCTEKLTSVKHCNGIDIWVIYHDWNSADFKSFLLTSAGVNTSAVVSTIGTSHTAGNNFAGCMKTSPNGKKLAVAIPGAGSFELFDFDNTTGVVSNSLSLSDTIVGAYGCEFSPDGTKLYGSRTVPKKPQLFQWDLCAGSPAAIAASIYAFVTTNSTAMGSLQRASDGKIYGARNSPLWLITINNPNGLGAACNYVELGISIAPKNAVLSLPNFITSFKRPVTPPFTSTVSCNTVSFSEHSFASGAGAFCQNVTFSVTSVLWDFGDPASGVLNNSMVNNPAHTYPAPGTYTTQLVLYYSCGGGNDTLRQTVNVVDVAPTLSVAGNYTICQGEKRTYTVTGANTYSWNTGGTTTTLSIGPSASTATYNVVGTTTAGCSSKKIFTVTVNKCTGISEQGGQADPLSFFPNPVSGILHLENTEKTQVLILNLSGVALIKKECRPGTAELDLSSLEDGVYFVRTTTAKGTQTRRLVKIAE